MYAVTESNLRNMRTITPEDLSPGSYRIACREEGNVILVYNAWNLPDKDRRTIFVPEALFKTNLAIPECEPVRISVETTKTPDGKSSVLVAEPEERKEPE